MTDTEAKALALVNDTARAMEGPLTLRPVDHVYYRELPKMDVFANALCRAIAAMQPAPQWQGIESAPRDGTFVLGFGPHNTRGSYREVIHWWGDRWTLTWMEGYGEPTHWMPLPTPPAGGSDAE